MPEVSIFTHATNVGSEVQFIKNKSFGIGTLDLSVGFFPAYFKWGPINKPTEVYSESELSEIFVGGNEIWKSLLILFRKFKPNKVVINRLAHYTDLTDKSTITAVKASKMLTDNEGTPKNVLEVEGRYHGAYGNNIKVTTLRTNKVTTETTETIPTGATSVALASVDNIEVGEILFIDDGTTDVYVKVTAIDGLRVYFAAVTLGATIATAADTLSLNFNLTTYVNGTFVREYTNLSLEVENKADYILNTIARDSNNLYNFFVQDLALVPLWERTPKNYTLEPLASGADGGAIIAADYIGNATTKLGIYALDTYGNGKLPVVFCVPEMIDATVHNAIKTYIEQKEIHFFLGDFAFNNDEDQAIAFLNTTAKLNSDRCAYHYPNLIFEDPENVGLYVTLKNSPFILGRFSMTDKMTDGGPFIPSAGVLNGTLPGVYGLEGILEADEIVVLTENPDVRDKLRRNKINPILKKDLDFYIESAFTRDTRKSVEYIHISQIRLMQYVAASMDYSLDWVLMQNHDALLEKTVKIIATDFVDALPQSALEGASPSDRRNIIYGPQNNERDPITGKIKNPEDFYLDIYLSILSPVLRTHIRLHKKQTNQ